MSLIKILRNDGEIFEFNEFKIIGLEGFGGLKVEVLTKSKAFGNGNILVGKRLPSRQLIIDSINPNKDIKTAKYFREKVRKFFNPNYTFTIQVNYKGIEKEIKVELTQVVLPTSNIYRPQALSVIFEALNPLFASIDKFGKDIASKVPMFGFPVYFMGERMTPKTPKGANYGLFNFDNIVDIQNNGDVATYFTAEIIMGAEVQDFALHQDENTFVKLNHTFKSGDKIHMDFENSYVSLNGANANTLVDKTSTWFEIPIGESQIYFAATVGETQVVVRLLYEQLYLEV